MTTSAHLRQMTASDFPAICELWCASIRGVCGPAYHNDESILAAWCKNKTPEALRSYTSDSQCCARVITDSLNTPLGFSLRWNGEIRSLYVTPHAIGRGLGSMLLLDTEGLARHEGVTCLELGSSRNALPFYERHGYLRTSPDEKLHKGIIPYIPMKKLLS